MQWVDVNDDGVHEGLFLINVILKLVAVLEEVGFLVEDERQIFKLEHALSCFRKCKLLEGAV